MVNYTFYELKFTDVIDLSLDVLVLLICFRSSNDLISYFLCTNFIMSKRFDSRASKRKRRKIESDMVKKIKPITTFLHQPLTEATGAGSGVGALTLARENQCDEADQPTASIQPEESVIKKQCWTLNSNLEMRKQPCPVKMKIQIYFRIQLLQRERKKKHIKIVETVKIIRSLLVK